MKTKILLTLQNLNKNSMKKLTLLFVLVVAFHTTKAQEDKNIYNPFEKHGYVPKIATLSQGKYNEFFDLDTIVQIGTVLFNTKSNEIVAFVERDTMYSEATLEPDVVSRWMSPDPLFAERSWVSPYNFVQNNPIMRIDPSGMLDDNYTVAENGDVNLEEETDDNFDRVYTKKSWDNGKKDNYTTIKKGILNKKIGTRTSDNKPKETFFVTNKNDDAKKLYEFLADNSNVEWAYALFSTRKNDVSIIGSNHSIDNNTLNSKYTPNLLNKHLDINILFFSHSHPGKYDKTTKWPAYPSGFDYKLNPTNKLGDRQNYGAYKKKYPNRIPTYFDIHIPNHPNISIMYNDKEVIRTEMPAINVK